MAPVAHRPAGLSRRDVFRLGAVTALGATGIGATAGCGAVPPKPDPNAPQKSGGVFSHGATGGGLEDTVDPHFPVTNPDIARVNNLYEPLLFWDEKYQLQPALATSVTPNADATEWIVELRKGVIFHHGKEMTAEDVLFTLARVTNPKNTGSAAASWPRSST